MIVRTGLVKNKIMKRIYSFSLALFFAFTCTAQAEFGIFAGPHATTARYTIQNVKQSNEFKFGFHAGAGYKIAFENKLYFSPAISYSLLGYKVVFNRPSFPPDLLAKNNNTTFHEVDVDLLLQYDFGNQPGHFFIKAGPSFNFVLSGNEKFDLITGGHVDRKMKYGLTSHYGRYLVSLLADLGYETAGGFFISAHYVHGLGTMNNVTDGPGIFNRTIGITFGKYFRSK